MGQTNRGAGSVHKERAGELDVVKGRGEFAALAVHIGLHVGDTVVSLFPSQVLEGKTTPVSQATATQTWRQRSGGGGWRWTSKAPRPKLQGALRPESEASELIGAL